MVLDKNTIIRSWEATYASRLLCSRVSLVINKGCQQCMLMILASFLQSVIRFAKVYKQCIYVNINIQTPDPYSTVLFSPTYAISLAFFFFFCYHSYYFTGREKTNVPYAHYFIHFSLLMHYLVPFMYISMQFMESCGLQMEFHINS